MTETRISVSRYKLEKKKNYDIDLMEFCSSFDICCCLSRIRFGMFINSVITFMLHQVLLTTISLVRSGIKYYATESYSTVNDNIGVGRSDFTSLAMLSSVKAVRPNYGLLVYDVHVMNFGYLRGRISRRGTVLHVWSCTMPKWKPPLLSPAIDVHA